jgi:hypothetical protein
MLKWDVDVVVHLQLDQWHESLFASQPKPILLSHLIYLFVIYIKIYVLACVSRVFS